MVRKKPPGEKEGNRQEKVKNGSIPLGRGGREMGPPERWAG